MFTIGATQLKTQRDNVTNSQQDEEADEHEEEEKIRKPFFYIRFVSGSNLFYCYFMCVCVCLKVECNLTGLLIRTDFRFQIKI